MTRVPQNSLARPISPSALQTRTSPHRARLNLSRCQLSHSHSQHLPALPSRFVSRRRSTGQRSPPGAPPSSSRRLLLPLRRIAFLRRLPTHVRPAQVRLPLVGHFLRQARRTTPAPFATQTAQLPPFRRRARLPLSAPQWSHFCLLRPPDSVYVYTHSWECPTREMEPCPRGIRSYMRVLYPFVFQQGGGAPPRPSLSPASPRLPAPRATFPQGVELSPNNSLHWSFTCGNIWRDLALPGRPSPPGQPFPGLLPPRELIFIKALNLRLTL